MPLREERKNRLEVEAKYEEQKQLIRQATGANRGIGQADKLRGTRAADAKVCSTSRKSRRTMGCLGGK